MALPEIIGNKFMYFAFGSNLLSKRIHIQNKTATRKGIGCLKDYQLDFGAIKNFSNFWNGVPATIIPKKGSQVFGAVWEINVDQLDELDRQEGVECGIYQPLSLKISVQSYEDQSVQEIVCRTYQLVNNPKVLENCDRPFDRQPSKTYLNVILNGARESKLSEKYIEWLEEFKHNGNEATKQDVVDQLNLKDYL